MAGRQMPPPPRHTRRPAPPTPPEPEQPLISPDISQIDLEAAIWVHGGYPQVPWGEAVRNLYAAAKRTPIGYLCTAALDYLDRHLPPVVDLTSALRAQLIEESQTTKTKVANDL